MPLTVVLLYCRELKLADVTRLPSGSIVLEKRCKEEYEWKDHLDELWWRSQQSAVDGTVLYHHTRGHQCCLGHIWRGYRQSRIHIILFISPYPEREIDGALVTTGAA